MFRTFKSKLAHTIVVAGTISMLLSSSALAGFHVGGGVRATSFVRAPAMARVTTAIHPSFERGSVVRPTNSPDRFVGARAVDRTPFPSNGIVGVASHPQGNLPAGVATLKVTSYGISSGWHAPTLGPSVGGNAAPSPGIAAYGVTVATAPASPVATAIYPGAPTSPGRNRPSPVSTPPSAPGSPVATATSTGAPGRNWPGQTSTASTAPGSTVATATSNGGDTPTRFCNPWQQPCPATGATPVLNAVGQTNTAAPRGNPTAPGLTHPLPYFPPPPFVQIHAAAQQAANAAKAAASTAAAANGALTDAQYGAQEAQTYANQACNTAAMVQQSLENPPGTSLGPQALALLQELVGECTTAQAAAWAADFGAAAGAGVRAAGTNECSVGAILGNRRGERDDPRDGPVGCGAGETSGGINVVRLQQRLDTGGHRPYSVPHGV